MVDFSLSIYNGRAGNVIARRVEDIRTVMVISAVVVIKPFISTEGV
tara:strand:+ start:11 stop:148 length:138 start_codon:yes stop_codon:yes gene_type:complete